MNTASYSIRPEVYSAIDYFKNQKQILPGVGVAMPMALAPIGVEADGVIMDGVAPPWGVLGVPKIYN